MENGLPCGRALIKPDRCELRSGSGRRWTVLRSETVRVEMRRIRLPFAVRTVVVFVGARDQPVGRMFVPARTRRMAGLLLEAGWPVVHTNWLRQFVARLRTERDLRRRAVALLAVGLAGAFVAQLFGL